MSDGLLSFLMFLICKPCTIVSDLDMDPYLFNQVSGSEYGFEIRI